MIDKLKKLLVLIVITGIIYISCDSQPKPFIQKHVIFTSDHVYASFPGIIQTENQLILPFHYQYLEDLKTQSLHPHYLPVDTIYYAISDHNMENWQIVSECPQIKNPIHVTRHAKHSGIVLENGDVLYISRKNNLGPNVKMPTKAILIKHNSHEVIKKEIDNFGPFPQFYPFDVEALPNGQFISSGYWDDDETDDKGHYTTLFMKSENGMDWDYISKIDNPFKFSFTESDILHVGGQKLICLLRTDWIDVPKEELPPKAGRDSNRYGWYLYQSESFDMGKTWSTPRQLDIWGHPPHLIRLNSSNILMVYGQRKSPFSIKAVLSEDDGKTWNLNTLKTLYTFEPARIDFGYPVSTQLKDGTIFTTFYGYSSNELSKNSPRGIFAVSYNETWLKSDN